MQAQTTQTANPPSPETIWAILQRVSEMQEKYARDFEKSKLEFDRKIGYYENLFGEISEHMLAPKMCEKFREFGFDFQRSSRNVKVKDHVNKLHFEIDILLENGDTAILVEIKTKLTADRMGKHIERLEKMRKYADLHGDKRTFLGAVAGVVVTDEVKRHVLEQGFYLIEPSGDNLNITSPDGKPKEF